MSIQDNVWRAVDNFKGELVRVLDQHRVAPFDNGDDKFRNVLDQWAAGTADRRKNPHLQGGIRIYNEQGEHNLAQLGQAIGHADTSPHVRKALEVVRDGIKGLHISPSRIEAIESSARAAATYASKIPGAELAGRMVNGKIAKVVAVAGVVGGTLAASSGAYAATGDFNKAAQAGYSAAREQAHDAINPKDRFSRGIQDIQNGKVSLGAARLAEGAGELTFGVGDGLERKRVEPVAERIFEEKGTRALTAEIIRTHEDPKYILLGNNSLPEKYNGQPMDELLKGDKFFNFYKDSLNARIEGSSGEQRDMWQGQLETINGYRQALKAEQGTDLPKPQMAQAFNGPAPG